MRLSLHFDAKYGNDALQLELWCRSAVSTMCHTITGGSDPDDADLAVMWGLPPRNQTVFNAFRAAGKPVLVVDYPFWNRPGKERHDHDFYKISLNGLHPHCLMQESLSPERYRATGGPAIQPWRKDGQYVLVAGMGVKGEQLYNYRPGEWDQHAVDKLCRHTSLPVIYRAKPSMKNKRHVLHARFDDNCQPIAPSIAYAFAVVTHHGNAAIEAVAAGIPAFVHTGSAIPMAETDLSRIRSPRYPDNREQFFANLAHWQWSAAEIAAGAPLLSLQARGLIKCA